MSVVSLKICGEIVSVEVGQSVVDVAVQRIVRTVFD